MLSSLSCRFVKLEPSSSADKLSARQSKINIFQSEIIRLVSGKRSDSDNNNGTATRPDLNRSVSSRQAITYVVFVILFLATFLIQGCISEDRPCFCNGKYYDKCPKSRGCRAPELIGRQPKLQKLLTPEFSEFHDYDHPDHVLDDNSRSGLIDEDFVRTPRDDLDVVDDDDRVVTHRKVYVSERNNLDIDPVIHPIQLKIPVRVDSRSALPPPKPIFKMRKYTTYERKPEIVEVPVTTTVIKPVGVSKDQIIGEDSSSLFSKE